MKYRIPVKFVQAAAGAKMNFALQTVWPVQDFAATGKDFAVQTGVRQTNYSPSVRAMLVHDPFRQGLPKSTAHMRDMDLLYNLRCEAPSVYEHR